MIPARRSPVFCRFFAGHAERRIRRTFGRVHVHGLDAAREAASRSPLLVVANHTAWWDALVALWLAERAIGVEAYAMMDARNLSRLPFFALIGAFGVDLEDPRDGARAVRHAVTLLDRPCRAVWIFPEGDERSPFAPLELKPGAALVGRAARDASVLPIAVRYVFGKSEAPEAWISIGEAFAPVRDVRRGVAQQRAAIATELARIDSGHGFDLVSDRRPSLFARLAERVLGWSTRALLHEAAASGDREPASAPLERRS